jgi:hypothetical protein
MVENPFPFVVVKNNKRKQTGQQRIEDLSYNNTLATVYMEPHTGIICSSCNTQDAIYVDADSHSRTCSDRRPHLRLSNGFIYESKVGVVGPDGSITHPKPFYLPGQDYRQVRDLCGISADLINRQDAYWTPSMPIQEGKEGEGKPTYKSYRWHYTFMTKTASIRDKQWGLPSPLYGARHKAIVCANSAQTNITEEITAVEDRIFAPRAALNAAEQEIAQLKSQKTAGKAKRTGLRKVTNEARAALESTQALLDTANKHLVENNLEKVTAKVAPTANGAAANGGSAETSTQFSDSDPRNVTDTDPAFLHCPAHVVDLIPETILVFHEDENVLQASNFRTTGVGAGLQYA